MTAPRPNRRRSWYGAKALRRARRSSRRRVWRRSSRFAAHPRESGGPARTKNWIPAFAGMSGGILSPHRAHACRHIDLRARLLRRCARLRARPDALLEKPRGRRRNKSRAQRVQIAVAAVGLIVGVEALRHDDVELILGARHRDVKEPPLLLDLVRVAGGQIRRDAAINSVEHEHRFPLLSFGGVDGGENEIILIEQRRARLIRGGGWRIKREVGEKLLARAIARGDLLELCEICGAHRRVV